jgi:curved DNA-binding protein CbpA
MTTEAPPAEESQERANAETETENPNVPEDLYERLGVDPDASEKDIQDAYRERMKEYHPDVNQNDPKAGHEWGVGLNEARDTLSDKKNREAYDKKREAKRTENERKKREEEEKRANEERGRAVTLGNLRREANDAENGQAQRDYDPNHPNPFWREQEALRTPFSRFEDKVSEAGEGAAKKARNFFRNIFQEGPREAQETAAEYEALVASGKAERVNELRGLSFADYLQLKKIHEKTGNFKDYSFRSVGVYDGEGNFTGTVRSYRIRKDNGR